MPTYSLAASATHWRGGQARKKHTKIDENMLYMELFKLGNASKVKSALSISLGRNAGAQSRPFSVILR